MTQSVSRRTFIQGAASLAGAGLLGGALKKSVFAHNGHASTPTGAANYPESVYTAKEYAFTGPAALQSGFNLLTLKNAGTMDHHAMLLKLHDGKTIADLAAAKDLAGLFAVSTSVGGPGSIGAGQTASVILDLAAGNYVMACVIPDADGVPHMAKGMALPITVSQAAGNANSAPAEDAAFKLTEYGFPDFPAQVKAGSHIWKIENVGAQLHELVLFQLADGVTADQALAILGAPADSMAGMDMSTPAPAAPFVAVSGIAPISPKQVNWLKADLGAGNYLATCFVPDAGSGAPHFALGMAMPFSVS